MIDSNKNEETNFSEPIVVEFNKLHQKVCKEAHRINGFVRFQKTIEGSYYASIAPMYDVLPLCIPHFRDRYADQPWIIYPAPPDMHARCSKRLVLICNQHLLVPDL